MPLRTLEYPTPSFANSSPRWPSGVVVYDPRLFVMSPALVRFRRNSVNELLGYQLAAHMGMTLLPHVGFWCPDPVPLQRAHSKAGRIGIALEWRKKDSLRSVAGWCWRSDARPNTVAKALVLSLLCPQGEVGMAVNRKSLIPFDLGEIFPDFGPVHSEANLRPAIRRMESAFFAYHKVAERRLISVLDDVIAFNLEEHFFNVLTRIVETPAETLASLFDLAPHPLAEDVAFLAAEAVQERLSRACMVFA